MKRQTKKNNLYAAIKGIYERISIFVLRCQYTSGYVRNEVRDNVILYETVYGASMTGNPYAMFRRLVELEGRNFIHVWVVNDPKTFDTKGYERRANVIFIRRNSAQYAYYLTAAKYLINNVTFSPYFIKKEAQVYINTWHGTPLKMMGKDTPGSPAEIRNVQRNFFQADYLMMPNAHTARVLLSSYDLTDVYPGKIIEEGYPRIDATVHTDRATFIHDELSKVIDIDITKKIVLYAPTWRGTVGMEANVTTELQAIAEQIQAALPSTHQLVLKVHPFVYQFVSDVPELRQICVSENIDANELLAATDILITDYSSIFFDFYVTNKPIILFVYDYEDYVRQRGLYLDLQTLDVQIAFTMDDFIPLLVSVVHGEQYCGYETMLETYCKHNLEGSSTERYIDIIFNQNEADYNVYAVNNGRANVVVYGGELTDNRMVGSLVALSKTIDYERFNVILLRSSAQDIIPSRQLDELNPKVKTFYRAGGMSFGFSEWILYKMSGLPYPKRRVKGSRNKQVYEREAKRLFGRVPQHIALDYSGDRLFWSTFVGNLNQPKKVLMVDGKTAPVQKPRVAKTGSDTNFDVVFDINREKTTSLLKQLLQTSDQDKA